MAGTNYDDHEVGISAHSFGPGTAVLHVDDVTITAGADPEEAERRRGLET